jgi:hypothetical protein
VWLRDAAGNANPSNTAETILRLDDQPPSVAFLPPSDAQPALARVRASESVSHFTVTEILIRRRGDNAWIALPVTTDKNGFSSFIDDERLADGVYELRARAVDAAGNERSTGQRTDGLPAEAVLPLRVKSSLRVGKPRRIRARGARGRPRYRVVLVERPRSRYGRTIPLRGRLTSPGGNPLAGRTVQVLQQTQLPSAPWQNIAILKTDRTGRFRFKALRGPSRTLRFRFDGSDTVRGQTSDVRLGVRATSSMSVDRRHAVNGDEVTFHGRLRGRPLPGTGKLIELQVRARGHWLTFGTTRASSRTGRWRFPYRFSATRGRVRYRFRVHVPRDASYPYESGSSRAIVVAVRGL